VFSLTERFSRVYLDGKNWQKTTKLQFESLPGRNSVWNVFWTN